MTEVIGVPRLLSVLPAGGRGVIHSLGGGRDFRSRVANLGFTPGATITIIQNYGHGPLLVALRGTLIALGRAEAANVVVGAIDAQSPSDPDPA